MASNGSKRKRRCPFGSPLLDLPDQLLETLASYLAKPSCALLAVAMTAPSSSWRTNHTDCQPSAASRAILSISHSQSALLHDDQQWETLDFNDVEKSFAAKLTDNDLGAILVCLDARNVLKSLKLAGLVNISGHGLENLRGSVVLEQIDLGLVGQHESPRISPEPMISEEATLPILDSVVDEDHNCLKHIVFPKKWRGGEREPLDQFLRKYHRLLDSRRYTCSKCDGMCWNWDWNENNQQRRIIQFDTCNGCVKQFCCSSRCGISYCYSCEAHYCEECVTSRCSACNACSECETLSKHCERTCDGDICEGCFHTCRNCNASGCENCLEVFECSNRDCIKKECANCFNTALDSVLNECDECSDISCFDCCLLECNKDWQRACSGCVGLVGPTKISKLEEKNKNLHQANENLHQENDTLHQEMEKLRLENKRLREE